MLTTQPSFKAFILQERTNRKLLIIAIVALSIQIVIFKLLYPYADFFSDSYSYIFAAANRLDVSIWPIGYSKFIWLIHEITYSDTALVVIQYLFIGLSELFLFFTLLFFYEPDKRAILLIFGFMFLNPLLLYISNYVSSDAIFLALSVLWFSQLLWIINVPHSSQVFSHAILLVVMFSIRYNAMYYPIVSAFVFIASRHRLGYKIVGVFLPVIFIGLFVNYTSNKNYEVTGTKQFSVFGGWQLANNALYMYPHITLSSPVPKSCMEFQKEVDKYFDIAPPDFKSVSPIEGAFYIKFSHAPLKQFLNKHTDIDIDNTGGVKSWGAVAPIFSEYGKYLIKDHPLPFTRYYLLPNAYNYIIPPLEKLEVYNLGTYNVSSIAKYWFHYPHHKVKAVSLHAQGRLLGIFPTVFLLINTLFLVSLMLWVMGNGIKRNDKVLSITVLTVVILYIANIGFSVLASPIVFRYQVFPMIIYFSFTMILLGNMDKVQKPVIA
jgi:hypothetical protein